MSSAIALRQQQQDRKSGHVNTLTNEQAEQLRMCWEAVFTLFETQNAPNATDNPPNTSTKNGKKTNGQDSAQGTSVYNNLARKLKPKQTSDNANNGGTDKYNESAEFLSAMKLYSPEEIRQAFWSLSGADDPDVIVLRFLRARKWDIEKAIAMLLSTLKWMLQTGVQEITKDGEEGLFKYFDEKGEKEGIMIQFTSGKSFIRGTDKEGRPVCYINVRFHKKEEQSFEVLQKFTIYIMETTRLMIKSPVETGCLVFNMEGFSLSNMDFPYVKYIIQCFEAYYPESLGVLIIHKAPWVFGGLWKLISPLLDPVVASKVRFTQNDKELLDLIPAENLISDLGGEDQWKYCYVPPEENENYRMKDEVTKKQKIEYRLSLEPQFESLTKQWIKDPNNTKITNERDQLKEQLRKAQLEVNPYVRARTFYHRIGVLKEDGTCEWGNQK
ncbi:6226_t:CDS:2 [Acaulospora morrowiae]|uniref:6226_t:CDS:1 n=1 Tax=Acaulospora morrowiae TaxID=94023 RepID=A0A9N8Z4S7_9GLOM|nr:6226_t:CDS:2 [Acaulospora morrowiae]